MRRGIGLRGYAQQDPLNEFKREAFALYDELRDLIRHGVASSIFRVTVTRQPAAAVAGGDPAVAAALAQGAAALRKRRRRRQRVERRERIAPAVDARPTAHGRDRRRSRRQRPSVDRRSCAAGRRHRRPRVRWSNRSATSRSPRPRPAAERRRAARSPGSPRAVPGSGGTTRAGAGPGRSTRSVTGAERPASHRLDRIRLKRRSIVRDLVDGGRRRLPGRRRGRRLCHVPDLDAGTA